MMWSGPSPPAFHQFEPGQSYLVFAANLDRSDKYYALPPGTVSQPDAFRQIADIPRADDDGVIRTLDDRSLDNLSASYAWMTHSIEEWRHPTLLVKEAHWLELNLLLTNSASSNSLYALEKLDQMSRAGRNDDRWRRSDDFKRPACWPRCCPWSPMPTSSLGIALWLALKANRVTSLNWSLSASPYRGGQQRAHLEPPPECDSRVIGNAFRSGVQFPFATAVRQAVPAVDHSIAPRPFRIAKRKL